MDTMVQKTQIWLNANYKYYPEWVTLKEDGVTGWATIRGLIRALQYQIGIQTPNGNFGPATEAACPTLKMDLDNTDYRIKNLVFILQGFMWCKGYSPGGFTGTFGENTKKGIMRLQENAGLVGSDVDGIASPKIFKALANMDAYTILSGGDEKVRTIQRNLNRDYHNHIGLIPCDGLYTKSTNRAIIYALQLEQGSSNPDGIWGPATFNACPSLVVGDSRKKFVLLLQYALYVNGYDPNGFDGQFGNGVKAKVTEFQNFVNLTPGGAAGKQTWASLLVSYGDKNRVCKACDQWKKLDERKAASLKSLGYEIVGRYLTKALSPTALDKNLSINEMKAIIGAGLRVFPIFQTYGGSANYFNERQGNKDAWTAIKMACYYGFEKGVTIYFAVDYDVLEKDMKNNIIPHFAAIKRVFDQYNPRNYKIGIYAPRNVCTQISEKGYASRSFVCDMSSGFSANIGYPLPKNWAFDQILETKVTEGFEIVDIDNNIWNSNNRDMGCGTLDFTEIDDIEFEKQIKINTGKEMLLKMLDFTGLKGHFGVKIGGLELNKPIKLSLPIGDVEIQVGTETVIGDTDKVYKAPTEKGIMSIPSAIHSNMQKTGDELGTTAGPVMEFKDFSKELGICIDTGSFSVTYFVNDNTSKPGIKLESYTNVDKNGYNQKVYSSITIYPNDSDFKKQIHRMMEGSDFSFLEGFEFQTAIGVLALAGFCVIAGMIRKGPSTSVTAFASLILAIVGIFKGNNGDI